MRKSLISILSFLMACVMLGTGFPFTAFATEKEDATKSSKNASINDDYSIESDSSFGDIISDALNKYKDTDENKDYSVTDVQTDNKTNTISATINAKEDCSINVGVYEEKTNDLVFSSVDNVESGQSTVNIKSEEDLPDNYVVKAVLTDSSSEPISTVYTDNDNTTWYQDYCDTSVDDFKDDRVVNLNDDKNDNFMVFRDDVNIINSNSVKETNKNKYVLSANSETAKIDEGEIFAYNTSEPEEMVVKKVSSKKVEGDSVVLNVEQANMEESFSLVKIHLDEKNVFDNPETVVEGGAIENAESSVSSSLGADAVTSAEEYAESATASTKSAKSNNISVSYTKSVSYPIKIGKASGSMTFSAGIKFKLEYSVSRFFVDVSLTLPVSATISVNLSGSVNKDVLLGKVVIPVYAVAISINVYASFEASFKGNVTVTVSSQLGFGYKSGSGLKNKCKAPRVDTSIKVNGDAFIGVKLEASIGIPGKIS